MTKFKVKPTQKENWRYIAFEVNSSSPVSEEKVTRAIVQNTLRLLGEIGAADANVWMLEFNSKTNKGILRCSHKAQTQVVAVLTTLTEIEKQKTAIYVLGVSGTIKRLKDKWLS